MSKAKKTKKAKVARARRVIGILRWPNDFPGRLKYGGGVIAMIGENSGTFTAPSPPLATLTTALGGLNSAEITAGTRALGAAEARDAKWLTVESLFDQELAYVQGIADLAGPALAPGVFAQAGMSTTQHAGHPPREYKMTQTVSTEVDVTVPAAGTDTAVIWEYGTSPTAMTSWIVTIHGILKLTNQTPGTTLYLRYRIVTTTGYGEWSQVISRLVT